MPHHMLGYPFSFQVILLRMTARSVRPFAKEEPGSLCFCRRRNKRSDKPPTSVPIEPVVYGRYLLRLCPGTEQLSEVLGRRG